MVIYRVEYEQKRINEQITVPKHTWKVKANATPVVQMMKKKQKQKKREGTFIGKAGSFCLCQLHIIWVVLVLKCLLRFYDWSPDIKSLITYFFPNGTIYYGNYKLSLF